MKDLPIYLAMSGFIVMGLGAVIKPLLVTAQFGILELSTAGRNEVRAVYGGFGILMGVALFVGDAFFKAAVLPFDTIVFVYQYLARVFIFYNKGFIKYFFDRNGWHDIGKA